MKQKRNRRREATIQEDRTLSVASKRNRADSLEHVTDLVDLPLFAGLPVSLPLLRSIVVTAPTNPKEVAAPDWQSNSTCAAIIREAEQKLQNAPQEARNDLEECKNYWLHEYPVLSEKTRSIITLSFSMLVRPFVTRPLRQLFSADTNVRPEDAFDGSIILIDLPVQEFRLAGRVANLAWKYCLQVAVLRRMQPQGAYLRPVFLWADEAQSFISDFDAEYQAVARSGLHPLLWKARSERTVIHPAISLAGKSGQVVL
jgi:hypothetical protein